MHVTYEEGRGVMTAAAAGLRPRHLAAGRAGGVRDHGGSGGVLLTLSGNGILTAPTLLAGIDGVTAIRQLDDDPD